MDGEEYRPTPVISMLNLEDKFGQACSITMFFIFKVCLMHVNGDIT